MNGVSSEIERTAAAWLARRDSDTWTATEQSAFETWLAQDIAHRVAWLRLEATWQEAGRLKVLAAGSAHGDIPARGAWARSPYFTSSPAAIPANLAATTSGIRRHTRQRRRTPWLLAAGLAAALVVAVVVGGLAWRRYTHVERSTWSTALGARQVVHLADGSTATLDSDTELRVVMSRHERDLYLVRGEAFFDVAHDRARPFVVHANGYHVIAVGTHFDVRKGDSKLRVVVTKGLVRLQSARDPTQAPAMLPPGSIALVDGADVEVRHVALDQAREYLSWRDGYVVFHGTPLADAVEEFNRYSARKIVIADPSLDSLRVGGHFKLDNSAAFVRLVQQVFPVRAQVRDGKTMLYRRASQARRD
ncbi:MAG: FecR family protein [Rhodanobacteraceae bacterium]